MKNKIRRAFTATEPNVLNRVLEDCDSPAEVQQAAPKKKRKLSDRTMQFIATAASIAILIGTVSGGFVYFRDYYAGQTPPGEENPSVSRPGSFWELLSPGSTDPTMDIEPVEPLPTVDYDSSEEGLVYRAMSIAIPPMQSYVPAYTFTEEGNEYVIRISNGGIAYTFRFSTANGALLAIEVADDGTNSTAETSRIAEAAAAWIALLDLDPNHYGRTQYADYTVTNITMKHDAVDGGGKFDGYCIEIEHGSFLHSYYVDSRTGEIFMSRKAEITSPADIISPEEAQKIALTALEQERGNGYLINCEQTGSYYCVTTCSTDDGLDGADMALIPFEYYVDVYTGDIVHMDKGLSVWGEEIAIEVAQAYAATFGSCEALTCVYYFCNDMPSYYEVSLELQVPGGNDTFSILVYEIYSTEYPIPPSVNPADPNSLLWARDIALGMPGISLDDVTHLEVSLIGDPYRVYFETKDLGYKYFLDQDGNVTYDAGVVDVIRPAENTAVTWKEARDLCLEACGHSLEELIFFGYEYRPEDCCYYMEMGFPDDSFVWFVDSQTGVFLDEPVVDILPPVVEGMIAYEQAWEIAVRHAGCLEEGIADFLDEKSAKLDESTGIFVINFRNGDVWWEIEIDAYTGEVVGADCWEHDIDTDHVYSVSHVFEVDETRAVELEICAELHTTRYVLHDALTGQIMEQNTDFPADAIAKTDAMNQVAQLLGMNTFTTGSVALQGRFSDGECFYCVVIPLEDYAHVALMDAITGEILYQTNITRS